MYLVLMTSLFDMPTDTFVKLKQKYSKRNYLSITFNHLMEIIHEKFSNVHYHLIYVL